MIKSAAMLVWLLTLVVLQGCTSLTSLYFYPSKQLFHDPKDHGIEYQTINLQTPDGETLSNWLFPAVGEVKGRVVFFHGNAENISSHFASVYWLPNAGYEVFLLDYRGYGRSSGLPVLPEVLTDLKVAFEWAQQRSLQDGRPVYVLGQSIGAALSTMAMSEVTDQPDCMVLDAGFGSFQTVAKETFQTSWLLWPFAYPASWLLPSDFEPEDYAPKVTADVLIFHSPQDQVISYDQGNALFSAFKHAEWVDSSGPHIATFNQPVYREKMLSFFEQCSSKH